MLVENVESGKTSLLGKKAIRWIGGEGGLNAHEKRSFQKLL
jgi:hypothetical protein